jgi:NADH-quinone oxidoreductase subunit C
LSDTSTEATVDAAQAARDAMLGSQLDVLREVIGDAVVDAGAVSGELCARVDRAAWHQAVEAARDRLGMRYFCFLSGIDWQPAPDLSGEKIFEPAEGVAVDTTDDEEADDIDTVDADDVVVDDAAASTERRTGVAGGESRFQVFARLSNLDDGGGIILKADLDDQNPEVQSIVDLFAGADWHEREVWEMYGFQFIGHPGLRHLYLPGEFEGYPLRKDFPLLAREVKPWPGLVDVEPLPGEPAGDPEAEGE